MIASEKHAGFSLTEIVIAITIMGILAVFVAPPLFRWIKTANKRKAQAALLVFKDGLQGYKLDVQRYPNALIDLIRKPSGEQRWSGPYVDPDTVELEGNNILDPWGQPYQYRLTPGAGRPFALFSLGDTESDSPEQIDVWKIR